MLMMMLLQEADCQNLRAQKHKQVVGKGKEDEKNKVLGVSMDKSGEKRDMSKITCWNCGDLGHFSLKCPKPKKSKDSKLPEKSDSKKEGTSADNKGAWAAEEVNSDNDMSDWFDEADSDAEVASGVDVTIDWFKETVAAGDNDLPELLALPDSKDESSKVDAGAEMQSIVDEVLLRNLLSCLNFKSFDSVDPVEGVVAIASDDVIVDDVADWFEEAVVMEVDDLPELLSISDSEDDASDIKEESTCGD